MKGIGPSIMNYGLIIFVSIYLVLCSITLLTYKCGHLQIFFRYFKACCKRLLQIVFYIFSIIGMEIFHGLITYHGYNESTLTNETQFCGNSLLNGTQFYERRYCSNNFNDVFHAFLVLFELLLVSNWHSILLFTRTA